MANDTKVKEKAPTVNKTKEKENKTDKKIEKKIEKKEDQKDDKKSTKVKTTTKTKDVEKGKRPKSGWVVFMTETIKRLTEEKVFEGKEKMKEAGRLWSELADKEKEKYEAMAAKANEEEGRVVTAKTTIKTKPTESKDTKKGKSTNKNDKRNKNGKKETTDDDAESEADDE
jgi:hypothetical protein